MFESRARAQEAIAAGLVRADGEVVRKASVTISPDATIEAGEPHPYVSRGGLKLAHALDTFALDPAGQVALDVGASTGGFTDVLLSRGASRVYAVDVGHGQLHPRLAADPCVIALEGTDVRNLDPAHVPDIVELVTVDVSFISLKLVVPTLKRFINSGGYLVALIKPQFEVGRTGIARGGIVRDTSLREAAIADICHFVTGQGFRLLGRTASPILGGDGNAEELLAARRG